MAFFVLAFIIFLIFVGIYQKITNAECTSRKNLKGKTVIITGGTSGMGLEMAKDLARREARLIVACPFEQEGKDGLQTIVQSSGNKNVEFKLLDLSSFESTRKFAADILKNESRLDILVNNAGVGGPHDAFTADGLNFIMQVNYYGAFLLTLLLLPLLKKTGTKEEPSRIVNASSALHKIGRVRTNANYRSIMDRFFPYPDSKICMIAFSREFTNVAQNRWHVVMNSVDPGAVGTRIFLTANRYIGMIFTTLCYTCFKTAREGAQTALHVALDSEAGQISGHFFRNCKIVRATKSAYDADAAKKLWDESIQIVQLTDKELELCLS